MRAGCQNITSGKTVQGGSTITQQLVRALYIKDPKRDFKRKIREAKMASELEKQHSKRWILKNYLNDVPYGTVGGRTAIGVEAAAETYFAKHAKDLTLAALGAARRPAAGAVAVQPVPEPAGRVRQRRNEVLQPMADNGCITRERGATATAHRRLRLQARHALHRSAASPTSSTTSSSS